jgi:hypothetical protein
VLIIQLLKLVQESLKRMYCWSSMNLTVTAKPTKISTPVTICSGETYTWDQNYLYSSRNIGNKWRMYCRPKLVVTVTLNQLKYLLSYNLFWQKLILGS